MEVKTYQSFSEFYPFYLSQHSKRICRVLHYIGSSLALILLAFLITNKLFTMIPLTLVVGYLFAWTGHYIFEKNRPATFKYPIYSFMGDWMMLFDAIRNRKL